MKLKCLFLPVLIVLLISCKKDQDPNGATVAITGDIAVTSYTGKLTITTNLDVDDIGVIYCVQPNVIVGCDTKQSFGKATAGDLEETIQNLVPGTTYYIRAYIIYNNAPIYSDEVSFTTTSMNFIDESKPIELVSIEPSGFPITIGQELSISGKYFGITPGNYMIKIGDAPMTITSIDPPNSSASISTIHAVVGAGTHAGSQQLSVTLNNSIPNNTAIWPTNFEVAVSITKTVLAPAPADIYGGGFFIDGKGYLLSHNSVWSYDIAGNQWTKKNDFPGAERYSASAFAVNGKGYICFGFGQGSDVQSTRRKDVWEYDPVADQWTQLDDFPGSGRYEATAVVSGNDAYIGYGLEVEGGPAFNDYWKFTPQTRTWTQLASNPDSGDKRGGAVSFVLDNKVYISAGGLRHVNKAGTSQVAVYDISSGGWSSAPSLPVSSFFEPLDLAAAGYSYKTYGVTLLAMSGTINQQAVTMFVFDSSSSRWYIAKVLGVNSLSCPFTANGVAYCKTPNEFFAVGFPAL